MKGVLVKLGLLGPEQTDDTAADVTAVARPAGEAGPPGIVKQSATTEPELAESSDGVGSSWSRAKGMNSAAAAAALKSAGEARFLRFVKYVKTGSEPELAESDERGQKWTSQKFGEWLVSEVRRHGSVDKFCQEMGV